MPNPPPNPQEQLLIWLEIFEDRLNDLENEVESLKNLMRDKPSNSTKPIRNWMLGLLALTVVLASTPIDITVGGVTYKSGGFPAEGFVAIAGIISGLYYGWDKYQKEGFKLY